MRHSPPARHRDLINCEAAGEFFGCSASCLEIELRTHRRRRYDGTVNSQLRTRRIGLPSRSKREGPPAPKMASARQPTRRCACVGWWAVTDSNRRHSACKADALPTELTALSARCIAPARARARERARKRTRRPPMGAGTGLTPKCAGKRPSEDLTRASPRGRTAVCCTAFAFKEIHTQSIRKPLCALGNRDSPDKVWDKTKSRCGHRARKGGPCCANRP